MRIGRNLHPNPSQRKNLGLYRDNGLLILRILTKRQAEINPQKIIKVFKQIDSKTADFLDIHSVHSPHSAGGGGWVFGPKTIRWDIKILDF